MVGSEVELAVPQGKGADPIMFSALLTHMDIGTGGEWSIEAVPNGPVEVPSGRQVIFPDGSKGFITRVVAETELIEVTQGPDWMVPARWEADPHRKFMPGLGSMRLMIRGPV